MVRFPPESFKAVIFDTQIMVAATANWGSNDESDYTNAFEATPLDGNQGEAVKVMRFPDRAMVSVGYWKPVSKDTSGRTPGYRGCTILIPQESYGKVGAHPALLRPATDMFLEKFDQYWSGLHLQQQKDLWPKLKGKDRSAYWELPKLELDIPDDPSRLVAQRGGHYLPLPADNYPLWEQLLRDLGYVEAATRSERRYLVVSGVKEAADRMAVADSLLWMLQDYSGESVTVLTSAPAQATQVFSLGRWQLIVVQSLRYGATAGPQGKAIDVSQPIPKGPEDDLAPVIRKIVEDYDTKGPPSGSRLRELRATHYFKGLSVPQFAEHIMQVSASEDSSDLPKTFETYLQSHPYAQNEPEFVAAAEHSPEFCRQLVRHVSHELLRQPEQVVSKVLQAELVQHYLNERTRWETFRQAIQSSQPLLEILYGWACETDEGPRMFWNWVAAGGRALRRHSIKKEELLHLLEQCASLREKLRNVPNSDLWVRQLGEVSRYAVDQFFAPSLDMQKLGPGTT